MDEDFTRLHLAIVDLLEREEDLDMEQAVLDEHEDRVGDLDDRLQQLVRQDQPTQREPTDLLQKGLHGRLTFIETELRDVSNAVEAMEPGPELDRCLAPGAA